jgi:steroid delta-isomerase-like uncharacterized protein
VSEESAAASRTLIERYYSAFNRADWEGMLELLDEQVAHHPNQGERRVGRERFRAFLGHMARCYLEVLTDVRILVSGDGAHAAAEYMISGQYLSGDEGLPPARGQRYRLAGGTFFDIAGHRITRVSNYCNQPEWIAQISRDD